MGRAFLLATIGWLLGCDPGWSVTATIAPAAGVDPSAATLLHFSATPVDDPERADHVVFAVIDGSVKVHDELRAFPLELSVGRIGTVPTPAVEVRAWLSGDDLAIAPAADDPQASALAELPSCGAWFGGFCGATTIPGLVLAEP